MLWFLVLLVAVLVAINLFFLRGSDLRPHDEPRPEVIGPDGEPSQAHFDAVASLQDMNSKVNSAPRRERLQKIRQHMNDMGREVPFEGLFRPLDQHGIRGEWVLAPRVLTRAAVCCTYTAALSSPAAPLSHRAITVEYARRYGGAVFALDYRLMPEHSRQAGIDDCRAAYRWLLDTGPDGPSRAREIFVSGDSAGGNLALSLSNWIRDQGVHAPNGIIALSPATDGTMSGPSMKSNIPTDHMLGPLLGSLGRVPKFLLRLLAFVNHRIPPSHPSVSPVFGDLGRLPPTLVHVSAQEMLLDDAVRYVNKARAQGSPVELQAWGHVLHVWHIFVRQDMAEAAHAFDQIMDFIGEHGEKSEEVAA